MSILIKDMKMPKSCDICPFMKTNDDLGVEDYRYMYCDFPGIGEFVTDYEASRHPYCPLIELPAQHGDLIDYNFCLKNYELLHDDDGNPVYAVRMRDINAAPAIIEAEEASE